MTAQHRDWKEGRAGAACAILLLVHESRRQKLHLLLRAIAPACRVQTACSPYAATCLLARGHIDLLLLDLRFEPGQPLAMIHLLARIAPSTPILAFDESASRLPIQPYEVAPWADVSPTLRRAIGAFDGCTAGTASAPWSQGIRP